MSAARATVRLLLSCDNRCVFCAQDGLVDQAAPHVDDALDAARAVSDEVTFVGGEPTLDPGLASHVARARARGFRRIGVQTNGGTMSDAAYTEALARAGLTDVHLSIHGGAATVHDYHTGIAGSFARALAAIAASRAAGLDVVVATVVTRSNFRVLAELPPLLASRGVRAWLLSFPRIVGRAARAPDRVPPRLALALPFALHALDAARAASLPAFVQGAPACLLGPFAARALPDAPRAYADACGTCDARPRCPGVDPVYLARFGGDELTPCVAVADATAPHADLTRMFVGTGETAPAAPMPEAPRPKIALPVLGKVKPAKAEVAAGAEKKTGDALREILPALFEPPEARKRDG